jgi:16S rRNA (uracil1498-N3)-methyltransferase
VAASGGILSFIPRLFLPSLSLKETQFEMEESLSKYLTRVLRLQEGDLFRGFDGRGSEFELRLGKTNGTRSTASVVLLSESSQGRQGPAIALAQSLPKASKMDVILRQCTEAGVHRFMPILTERSISRPEVSQYDHKNNRWQKIIVEACRQCGRADLPSLDPVLSFEQLMGKFGEFDLILLPYEKEAPTLKTVL